MNYEQNYLKFQHNNPHVIAYRNRRWLLLALKTILLEAIVAAVVFIGGQGLYSMKSIILYSVWHFPL